METRRTKKLYRKSKFLKSKVLVQDMSKNYIENIDERSEIAGDGKFEIQPSAMLDYCNAQYVIQISVGTKKDTYKVVLDTGSTTNLLLTYKCQSTGCKQHKKYVTLKPGSTF